MTQDDAELRSSRSDPVGALLVACMEQIAKGDHGAIESVCREHPEHSREIRERMGILLQMGLVEGISADADSFPERLGEFQLVRRLGGGGMGVVYEALQDKLGRTVALKLIRPEHLYFPRARERFRRETEAVARLQHPGIVSIYTVGEERGIPFFAMELIRGATLADVLSVVETRAPESLRGEDLRTAVLSGAAFEQPEDTDAARELFSSSWTDAAVRVVHQVAEALAHAHSRGVLHRDIKPSNIAITPEGRVVLLDFGLASASIDVRMTTYGTAVGSVLYMAPEQIEGKLDEIDVRTDVYALGVTLYELLTLQVPYSGKTAEEVRSAIRAGAASPLQARNHRVSRDLDTVCRKAIEGERGQRYATMALFAADLQRVLQREPVSARPPGPLARGLRWVARHPTGTTAVALALMLVVGVPSILYVLQLQHAGQLERALDAETRARRTADEERSAADRERERAQLEARDSEAVAHFLVDIFAAADPLREQGRRPTAEELLRRGVARIESELADQPELRARLQERMAESFEGLALHEDALPLAGRALKTRVELYEPDDLRVADSLLQVGNIRRLAGRTDQGIAELRLARDIFACRLGRTDRRALTAQVYLASSLIALDQADGALSLLDDALLGQTLGSPDDIGLRRTILDALAYANMMTGRLEQTERIALELLQLQAEFGSGEYERGAALGYLAAGWHGRGPLAVRSLLEEAAELARRLYGARSPLYAHALSALAHVQIAMNEPELAKSALENAWQVLSETVGPEHPKSLHAAQVLAEIELRAGDGLAARDRLARVTRSVVERLGSEHPRPSYLQWRTAQVALAAGDIPDAIERLQAAVEQSWVKDDPDGGLRARVLGTLANARLFEGNVEQARAVLVQLGDEAWLPGGEEGVLALSELKLLDGDARGAIEALERSLALPGSRMREAWALPALSYQLTLARMTAAPATIQRRKLEVDLGAVAGQTGLTHTSFRRLHQRATELLMAAEVPEASKPGGG